MVLRTRLRNSYPAERSGGPKGWAFVARQGRFTQIVNGLALASVLFASVGVHLIHPLFHEDLDAPPPVTRAEIAHPGIAPTGAAGSPSAAQSSEDECPICRFLKVFRSPTCPTAATVVVTDASTIRSVEPGSQLVHQDILKAVSPRGPPA